MHVTVHSHNNINIILSSAHTFKDAFVLSKGDMQRFFTKLMKSSFQLLIAT